LCTVLFALQVSLKKVIILINLVFINENSLSKVFSLDELEKDGLSELTLLLAPPGAYMVHKSIIGKV